MKTRDDIDGDVPAVPEPPLREQERSRGRRWLTGLIALLVMALVVGTSAVVFAQFVARQGHSPSGSTNAPVGGRKGTGTGMAAPPAGQWAAVLSGYEISSLVAARSDPSVLYACASHMNGNSSNASSVAYTLLRSSDYGTHWQDVGSKAGFGTSCLTAVNPANSNDVYVVGAPVASPTASVAASTMLWHSTDGGQTWTTILPTLRVPGSLSPTQWQVQQIRIEGGQLYGLQWFAGQAQSRGQDVQPLRLPMARLVTSVDGGQTWTVVDSSFIQTNQGLRDYAIDPTSTRTIYELVGVSGFVHPGTQPGENIVQPAFAYNVSLYKTTDGGATWHLLLSHLPYASLLYLAADNPQVLYVGGSVGPLPYTTGRTTIVSPAAFGFFQLHVSTDGGASWKLATDNTQALLVRGWFVSPDGRAFLATAGEAGVLPRSTPTAVRGTAVPTGQSSKPGMTQGAMAAQAGSAMLQPITTPPPAYPIVKSYDPATGAWSNVTMAPDYGVLSTLTPAGTNGGAILWLLAGNNVSPVLYRYITL